MAVKSSGTLSFNTDIVGEFGGSTPHSLSEYYGVDSGVPSSGTIAFSDFYGASNVVTATGGSSINGQTALKQIRTSSYISSGGTFQIPSNYWIWSDNVGVAALIIDTPNCTVVNSGKIIGRGGNGRGHYQSLQNGGPAISVTAGGVTIRNMSGAYIAGGGGGGGGEGPGGTGGGGAGGGAGGDIRNRNGNSAGGAINARGEDGVGWLYGAVYGGQAGGSGGIYNYDSSGTWTRAAGGGRILPGLTSDLQAVSGSQAPIRDGGGGGQAGGNGGGQGNSVWGGGGGGWGAAGGNYFSISGGSGGAAVSGSHTKGTWSGTVYGSS